MRYKSLKNFTWRIVKHRIFTTVLKGFLFYFTVTFIFGLLYYFFDALEFNLSSKGRVINLGDCFYFSSISFTTIGYGEIIPQEGPARIIVWFESCFALVFPPLFGAFLAYKFLQRPNDIHLTENFFIRYRNNHAVLSVRLGNKGENIVDCNATIELIHIVNDVNKTQYKQEFSNPLVELTWYLDIRLDDAQNTQALSYLNTMLEDAKNSLIRVTVIGVDSDSGNTVHVYKYYQMDKLLTGGTFKDVFSWVDLERTDPDWDNFNQVSDMNPKDKDILCSLVPHIARFT